MTDLRPTIQTSLKAFADTPLREAGLGLLSSLGYQSDRTLAMDGSPETFLEQFDNGERKFSADKALVPDWKRIEVLFQLTGTDLSGQQELFNEKELKQSYFQSYLFFAVELTGENYARGRLSQIARQLNRLFPMPVMLLIKHREQKQEVLSIAVINRRAHKRDTEKEVLGKVTLIRNISIADPHRGHLDILADMALPSLEKSRKGRIDSFDALHTAWEEVFNVELLNKRFYRELANWYFWALPQVSFPEAGGESEEKRNATGLIRLLTRLIFCWFIKEKGLVPEELFDREEMERTLTDLDEDESTYYCAILQNLFFATLNQRMGKNHKGEPYRRFALDEGFLKNRDTYGIDNLYRYEGMFLDPDSALTLFADVPFLNGGLFECLDRTEEDGKKVYIDGFSRNPKRRPVIPNRLFFSGEQEVDLSGAYGEKKRNHEKARGLLHILHSYKFTIVENTPVDQEIALDPELLGKVFENLLASYNEETKTTARKQTGSFYTPRPIVDYMVDESLKAYLRKELCKRCPEVTEDNAKEGLEILFSYTEKEHAFSEEERIALIQSIDACKILDPACGSGAFPMGILHKLVFILGKLDPGNERWKETQLAKLDSAPMREELERAFEENDDDYGRKLYLIENCLYGVDIQPIAIQISKLRFFISLVCDQKTNRDKAKNHGIRPLPNLETKFVAADTLIRLPEAEKQDLFIDPRVEQIEQEIENLYHSHFGLQRRDQKITAQKKLKALREELAEILANSLGFMSTAKARHVAEWDPFNPQSVADFFDPHWMFGRKLADGFDIVIGNPPYIQIQKFPKAQKDLWVAQGYQTYAATADVYCLFYERGAQLLNDRGYLYYITSNKWMRAGYGEKLRHFLSEKVDTEAVLDFGMAQNFGAATTYTNILAFENTPPEQAVRCCYATDDKAAMADPKAYFEAHAVEMDNLNQTPWVVVSKERHAIKQAVEAQGIPLEQWDLNIYRGVLTGFNDAFYISEEDLKKLPALKEEAADLLVPLLRGRHVGRYETSWDKTWMINSHNGIKAKGIPRIDVPNDYPVLFEYLQRWEPQLKKRQDKGDHWTNLRNCAYVDEFQKPKIIYQDIAISMPFYMDDRENFYFNNTCWMMTADENVIPYLTAVFNSSLFRFCFRDNFPEYSGNACRMFAVFFEKIPLKKPTPEEKEIFETLVHMVQLAKREKLIAEAGFLERLIDACVLESYFPQEADSTQLNFKSQTLNLLGGQLPISKADLKAFLNTANAPSHPLRNQLIRLTSSSPEVFGVIKEEGRV